MARTSFLENSRVRIAPSSKAIDALDDLIKLQPVMPQEKTPTEEEWRAKQMKILAHHPLKPERFVGRQRSE